MEATRRDVLKAGGLGALGVAGVSALPWGGTLGARQPSTLPAHLMPRPFRTRLVEARRLRPYASRRDRDGRWVDYFEITERVGRATVVPGLVTKVFGYDGEAPGPTVKIMRGRRANFRVRNKLPARNPLLATSFETSVHLHGAPSGPEFDGYANDVTHPGFYKEYHYDNESPARTMWYHDHAAHHTGQNAYGGLFAQYHMHDRAEMELLPQGEFDVALTVGDAQLGVDGGLTYDDNSSSGLAGDVILVNGRPWPVMPVKRRVYRFRLLVASTARSFRFRLSTDDPVTFVATDAGLMPRSREIGEWRQGSGERVEFLIDFSKYRPGQRVVLRNLSNKNNRDFADTDKVMAFRVTDAPFSRRDHTWRRIPDRLVNSHVMDLRESQATRTRREFILDRTGGFFTINGLRWEEVVQSDFELIAANPGLNDVEIWDFVNKSGGWFHPAHAHMVDFQMLSRNGRPPFDYERGPKDTVYVGENESVRVLIHFLHHRGRYMLHCHNLAHEDHDMMIQYAVGWRPGQPDPHHPILAAMPKRDNLPRRPRPPR